MIKSRQALQVVKHSKRYKRKTLMITLSLCGICIVMMGLFVAMLFCDINC